MVLPNEVDVVDVDHRFPCGFVVTNPLDKVFGGAPYSAMCDQAIYVKLRIVSEECGVILDFLQMIERYFGVMRATSLVFEAV